MGLYVVLCCGGCLSCVGFAEWLLTCFFEKMFHRLQVLHGVAIGISQGQKLGS